MIIKYEPGIYEVVKGGYRFDGIWREGICKMDSKYYKFFVSWDITEDCYVSSLRELTRMETVILGMRLYKTDPEILRGAMHLKTISINGEGINI